MTEFTSDELRFRSFFRVAWLLHHYWEEQKDMLPREARVSSRIFDELIYPDHINLGESVNGTGHREHLVPCALIRNYAFDMYWNNKTIEDVAIMIERNLKTAHITKEEAAHIDHTLGYKTTMPKDWCFETGLVTARLDLGGIKLKPIS